ncbi:MAG: DUF4446 family protein [Lachnospiraceae bacterium]|nr:DUF4446 family protein [Lachnospiraceae bacterium]
MNQSNILNYLGLGWFDPAIIIIVLLLLILILFILHFVQGAKIRTLRDEYEKFMEGKDGKSLEDQFGELFTDISELKTATRRDKRNIDMLLRNIESCYQKMGLVKYDAFHEMGGKLSFALCMLDKNDNGYIMNSVHSNNGCYTYTKEIVEGKSAIELGFEEKEALEQAVNLTNSKDHHDKVIREASQRAERAAKRTAGDA